MSMQLLPGGMTLPVFDDTFKKKCNISKLAAAHGEAPVATDTA